MLVGGLSEGEAPMDVPVELMIQTVFPPKTRWEMLVKVSFLEGNMILFFSKMLGTLK